MTHTLARAAFLFLLITTSGAGEERALRSGEPVRYAPTAAIRAMQQAYLKASNPGGGVCINQTGYHGDNFGTSLALSGDTLVIGAPAEDSNATVVNGAQGNDLKLNSGAAYVLTRTGSSWSQEAYLKASNSGGGVCGTTTGDRFGTSVSIDGDTLVVGALFEDSDATGVNGSEENDDALDSGAVYVFVRSGESWIQQAYLKASNTGRHDNFGSSVSISGDTLVVGAPGEDSASTGVNGDQQNNAAFNAGAAYVFVRSGGTWIQEAYLKASNTHTEAVFGHSVSLSGTTVLIGAYREDGILPGSGAAYVFVRDGSEWSQQAYLKASNVGVVDLFGFSVALSGNTAVVGAISEDSGATGVNGNQLDESEEESGAAYVFERVGSAWSQQAYIKASNTQFRDNFGSSVAVAGHTILVGAFKEDSSATGVNGTPIPGVFELESGAAYLFARAGTSWSQVAYVKASNTEALDHFGAAVAASGCTFVVGAPLEDSGSAGVNGDQSNNSIQDSGAAYLFELGSSVLFRNAGTNPASYAADPLVLGSTFTASVDNGAAAQLTSLVFAFGVPFSLPLPGGQTLLCLDDGSGELFSGAGLSPSSSVGGVDSYSLPVPANPAFCGLTLHSQAIQFGNPPFALSNAQDLRIGSF